MAMVMPRARSSGALSIESNERNSASPLMASTLVIAAVKVVFPWSTCPIVPTFTCGLFRSNFFFAIWPLQLSAINYQLSARAVANGRLRADGISGGAHDQIRTGDLVLTKNALCRLSYVGRAAVSPPATLVGKRRGAVSRALCLDTNMTVALIGG